MSKEIYRTLVCVYCYASVNRIDISKDSIFCKCTNPQCGKVIRFKHVG